MKTTAISNWNNYPVIQSQEIKLQNVDQIREYLKVDGPLIGRGNGRSYGDASLANTVCSVLPYDSILEFDDQQGTITAQSGLLLKNLLDIVVPSGWFLPVTPGTSLITLAGAVAADVHGKNHHVVGSFSNHVLFLDILLSNGDVVRCSQSEHTDLFNATCGGMGLTGLILAVSIQLIRIETAWIRQRQIKSRNLDELLDGLEAFNNYTYSVAWLDCLAKGRSFGRGIIMLGEHAKANEVTRKKSQLAPRSAALANVPFFLPEFLLDNWSISLFNNVFFQKARKSDRTFYTHYNTFFYPLDAVNNWNRIYGRRGFLQYQFVVPMEGGQKALKDILMKISSKGWGSFLTVLKIFGAQSDCYLSFPLRGYTLALDFPLKHGLFEFLEELDRMVVDSGGRLYLAKDARMSSETYFKTYKNHEKFMQVVRKYNPEMKFASSLSQRLAWA